jgi:uncharacterized membrane protein YphA (DoxX/SURF4 family)
MKRSSARFLLRAKTLWPGGQPVPLGSLLGLAGIIEIVLGLLISIGLFTSYAAFIASGEMAVAYFNLDPDLSFGFQRFSKIGIV